MATVEEADAILKVLGMPPKQHPMEPLALEC